MVTIWLTNSFIALCFVIYWIAKWPSSQKDILLFRAGNFLVSILTIAYYAAAFSIVVPILMLTADA